MTRTVSLILLTLAIASSAAYEAPRTSQRAISPPPAAERRRIPARTAWVERSKGKGHPITEPAREWGLRRRRATRSERTGRIQFWRNSGRSPKTDVDGLKDWLLSVTGKAWSRLARSQSTTKPILIASQIKMAEMARWSSASPLREVWLTPAGCHGSVLQYEKLCDRRGARDGQTRKAHFRDGCFQD